MKKTAIFALIFVQIIALCSCSLISLKNDDASGEFFAEEYLAENNLDMLPIPKLESSVLRKDKTLYLNLSDDEYIAYLEQIVKYLRERDDVFNLSKYVKQNYLMIIPTESVYAPIGDGFVLSCESVKLAFSRVEELTEDDDLIDPICISLNRQSGTLSYSGFTYNCSLTIGTPSTSCRLDRCYYNHTYDEGEELIVPATDGVKTVTHSTCVYCGQTHFSKFIGDMKYYNVSFAEGGEYVARGSGDRYVSGVIVDVCVAKLHSNLILTVNGTEISGHASGEDALWHYTFVMPCEDITLSLKAPEASPTASKKLTELEPWLATANAEGVAAIKIVSTPQGVKPCSIETVYRTENAERIANILASLREINMMPTAPKNAVVDGGRELAFEFTLANGEVHSVAFNNGCYLLENNNSYVYYKTDNLPKITEGEGVSVSYSFIAGKSVAYPMQYDSSVDGYKLAEGYEIDLSELEFVPCTESETENCPCIIQNDYVRLSVLGNTTFKLGDSCYRLVNTTFRAAITPTDK